MPVRFETGKLVCDECDYEYIIVGTIRSNFVCHSCGKVLIIVDEVE